MHSNSTLITLNEASAERELRGRQARERRESESFEQECKLLATILAACCLSLRELEDDPVSTDQVAGIFCDETGLERGDFDRLVHDVRATLASARRKLRDTSLRFRATGSRHRTLDEIERQPDYPKARAWSQCKKWPRD